MKINNLPSGPLSVNTYLVEDENTKKAFVVDPGGHNPGLTNQVKSQGLTVEYIILTHGHGDHIGGVADHLKDFPQAKVVACEKELPMLQDPQMNMSAMVCGKPVILHPDICVKDGDTLEVGTIQLKFIHTPGHSPGGMCILADDNVLFSGDTLFNQSIGRTDFPGSSFQELADAVHNKLFILPDETKVFPGHMGPTAIGYEKEHNPFV